jgi:methionyl-tRNA formyltransferase
MFAVPALKAVIAAGYQVELVVSQPDRPSGRGLNLVVPPVKEMAGGRHSGGPAGEDSQ